MKSSQLTVKRLKQVTEFRGVKNQRQLSEITELTNTVIKKIHSDAKHKLKETEIQTIASALHVDFNWLMAEEDSQPPQWTTCEKPLPAELNWREELAKEWKKYLLKDRCNKYDKPIQKIVSEATVDGKEWPVFRRSSMLFDIAYTFTLAQQHSLAHMFGIPTPEYATTDEAPAPKPTGITIKYPWPLDVKIKSGAHMILIKQLHKAKKARLKNKPLKIDKESHLLSESLNGEMKRVYDYIFPDDRDLTLYESVVSYRDLLKYTIWSPEEVASMIPLGESIEDFAWGYFEEGHIYHIAVIKKTLRFIMPDSSTVDTFIKERKENGQMIEANLDKGWWLIFHPSEVK